jgi:hypothetical protein
VSADFDATVVPAAGARRIAAAYAAVSEANARAQEIGRAVLEGMGFDLDAEKESGFKVNVIAKPDGTMVAVRAPLSAKSAPELGAAVEYEHAPSRSAAGN